MRFSLLGVVLAILASSCSVAAQQRTTPSPAPAVTPAPSPVPLETQLQLVLTQMSVAKLQIENGQLWMEKLDAQRQMLQEQIKAKNK